ncbi:hypothetical protein LINGRAHAP2_LOCUS14754 [Linum grandiflorum]
MAELAIPTGHGGEGASLITVFIDTTLDTHLAMDVSSSDTVAHIKKKIIKEHLLCFPKFGAITINALKVKSKGLYYYLAESMLMKSAFGGNKNRLFVCVEAPVIVCMGKEIEGMPIGLVGSESRREEKSDGQAQGVEVEATKPKIDGSLLRLGDLNHQVDGQAQFLEVQVMENSMEDRVLHGGDLNDNSDVKEKCTKRKRRTKVDDELRTEGGEKKTIILGLAAQGTGQVLFFKESKKDDLVSEQSHVDGKITRKPLNTSMLRRSSRLEKNGELPIVSQLPTAIDGKIKRKKKSSKKLEEEINAVEKQARRGDGNVVSELDNMTSEPLTVSQLPIGDDQQLMSASSGRAKKSSRKLDKEINAGGEVSLKDGRSNNANVVSKPNDMNCDPHTVFQLPVRDGQQLGNATTEGSEAKTKRKRKKKSSKKIDKQVNVVDEQSMNEAGDDDENVVSEPNDMNGEPLTVSQFPIGGKQQVVNAATVEADTRKKRKRKSSSKMDKEVNVNVEQSLKEAGGNNGNVVEEPRHAPAIAQQEADEHMLQPFAMSLNDKDTTPIREAHHNNLPSQDINDFQEPVSDEMHRVATGKVAVFQTISTEVHKEVHSELSESVLSLGVSVLKKPKKSRKHKDLLSGTPVTSDLGFVKKAVIDNPIHEAAEKDGKEAVVAESPRESLLVAEEKISEIIKNLVDSVPQATKSKTVVEVKEWKSKKKPISLPTQAEDEDSVPPTVTVVSTRTGSLVAKSSKVGNDGEEFSDSGVNFMAYSPPNDQGKKTFNDSEFTGAFDKATSKLLGSPSLTGKGGSDVNPHVGSSGKEKKLKEVEQPNAAKEAAEEHYSESFTSSTSKPKRNNKVQSVTQKGNVNTGEDLNPKPLGGLLKRNLFGDGSDDSLETYVFPSQRQSCFSIPDTYADVSSNPDGESGAGFNGGGRQGMKTP